MRAARLVRAVYIPLNTQILLIRLPQNLTGVFFFHLNISGCSHLDHQHLKKEFFFIFNPPL